MTQPARRLHRQSIRTAQHRPNLRMFKQAKGLVARGLAFTTGPSFGDLLTAGRPIFL